MKKGIWQLVVCVAALALAGCTTYSLEELRQTTPKGNDFQKALARHYLKFAEEKERKYDWYSVMHFADKGLIAAYGSEVGPEELSNWDIPDERLPELEKARVDLLAALTAENREAHGEMAALAQFSFDCWVNYAYGNWQEARISDCREAYYNSVKELTKPAAPVSAAKAHYTVYFQWGEYEVSAEGQKVIDEVVAELEPVEQYEVVLSGHADKSGGSKFNLMLSQKRVEAVKARLIAGSIKDEFIQVFAYGESDPAGKTEEKDPKNRRVEISLGE